MEVALAGGAATGHGRTKAVRLIALTVWQGAAVHDATVERGRQCYQSKPYITVLGTYYALLTPLTLSMMSNSPIDGQFV